MKLNRLLLTILTGAILLLSANVRAGMVAALSIVSSTDHSALTDSGKTIINDRSLQAKLPFGIDSPTFVSHIRLGLDLGWYAESLATKGVTAPMTMIYASSYQSISSGQAEAPMVGAFTDSIGIARMLFELAPVAIGSTAPDHAANIPEVITAGEMMMIFDAYVFTGESIPGALTLSGLYAANLLGAVGRGGTAKLTGFAMAIGTTPTTVPLPAPAVLLGTSLIALLLIHRYSAVTGRSCEAHTERRQVGHHPMGT